MTAGVKRRVRVIVEGEAHDVSDKCGILRIDLPADETGVPVVMVNPDWEGVTVEDVTPAYNWQDGDVVLIWNDHERKYPPIVISRHDGEWRNHLGSKWAESDVEDALASRGSQEFRSGEVLRCQAGAA